MIIASEAWFSTLVKLLTVGKARGESAEKATIIPKSPTIVP